MLPARCPCLVVRYHLIICAWIYQIIDTLQRVYIIEWTKIWRLSNFKENKFKHTSRGSESSWDLMGLWHNRLTDYPLDSPFTQKLSVEAGKLENERQCDTMPLALHRICLFLTDCGGDKLLLQTPIHCVKTIVSCLKINWIYFWMIQTMIWINDGLCSCRTCASRGR